MHDGRAPQRDRQAGADADQLPEDGPRHSLQHDVRAEGVPAGRHAALLAGSFVGPMADRAARQARVSGLSLGRTAG